MINTFDDLVLEVSTHSKRPDKLSRVPVYIRLAEAMIDRILRSRINEESWSANLDTIDRKIPLPTGYLNMRVLRIILNDRSHDLISCSPESLRIYPCKSMPRYFSVTNNIEFDAIPDKNYRIQMVYYKKLEPLSLTNQTNDILTNFPDLYLYLTLSKLHLDARDEETAKFYESQAKDILNEIAIANARSSHGSAPAMVTEGPTP